MKTTSVPSSLFIALLSIGISAAAAQDKAIPAEQRPTAVPSKSADEAIKRFVQECAAITPGKDGFPKEFTVGSQTPTKNELPFRHVTIDYDFRVSKYEMTQEMYQAVTGTNPSRWKGPRNSVENVSFTDSQQFCRKLTALLQNRKLIAESDMVRLPTSLEWEYCCRAGASTKYCFGDDAGTGNGTELLDAYAWHTGNAAGNDPAVGVLKPNSWGLHDVHGYLWEFVSDGVPETHGGKSPLRVIRGGSWRDHHSLLSSSSYLTIPAEEANDGVGFRCVIAKTAISKIPPR